MGEHEEPRAVDQAARVYGRALFEAAQAAGAVQDVRRDLDDLVSEVVSTPGLARVLFSPRIPRQAKENVLLQLVRDAHPILGNTLRLLLDRARLGLLPDIAGAVDELTDREQHVVEVEALSPVPLSEEVRADLERRLTERTGRTVNLTTRVDENLIGGIVLRVGDRVVDLSVRGRLDDLRRTLAAG